MIAQHGTLEISRSRLRHNLKLLQQRAGSAKLCPVVKANAYGHGSEVITSLVETESIEWICVYSLEEAETLAWLHHVKALVLSPLVLTAASPDLIKRIADWRADEIRLNITDIATARFLSQSVSDAGNGATLPIHIQIDTGLTRLGIDPENATTLAQTIATLPHLRLEILFAHFSHGEVPNHPSLTQQLATFHKIATPLKQQFPHLLLHLQNSGSTFNLSTQNLDLVRIGIALYGLQPSTTHPIANLQPIAQLTAPILALHDRPANTGVGYGHTFTTTRTSRLAIVPVGYADGYPRALSNNAIAQLHGQNIPLVGRISMDQIILDITDLPKEGDHAPKLDDTVTLISHDPTLPNSLDRMADTLGTIGYELATHLGSRLHRVIID